MRAEEDLLNLAVAARAAWPAFEVPEGVFVRHIELHLASAADRTAALARIRADDLYLACACAAGDKAAIGAFDRRFAAVIERAAARFGRTEAQRDELKQLLRERLLVAPPGGQPKIATYSGQGFLENWVRVAAVRAFLNEGRAKKIEAADDGEALSALPDGRDLELDFLKVHYRSAFRRAFAASIEALEPSERLVLRLTVLDGLTSDELAASLGVHRATAARRAARARARLIDTTRQELARSLRVDGAELASILRLVESHFDLSLSRLLGPEPEPAGSPAGAPVARE